MPGKGKWEWMNCSYQLLYTAAFPTARVRETVDWHAVTWGVERPLIKSAGPVRYFLRSSVKLHFKKGPQSVVEVAEFETHFVGATCVSHCFPLPLPLLAYACFLYLQ